MRVWRAETWLPWSDVLFEVTPGSVRLVVPSRWARALANAAAESSILWILIFFLGVLPAVGRTTDPVAYDLRILALAGGAFGLAILGYVAYPRLLTYRPRQALPAGLLSAGPEGNDSYAEVALGGVGTRVRIKASWSGVSRTLTSLMGQPGPAVL